MLRKKIFDLHLTYLRSGKSELRIKLPMGIWPIKGGMDASMFIVS